MDTPEKVSEILPRAVPSKTKRRPNSEPEPEIVCSLCSDTGWLHPVVDETVNYFEVVRCECKAKEDRERKRKRLLNKCGLPFGTEDWTFDSFKVDKNYPSLQEARKAAIEYAEGISGYNWLILKGKVDRGKSHLAVAICRRWLERGIPAIYTLVPAAMDKLRDGYELEGEESYRRQLQLLKEVDLLILDDLGAQKPTVWAMERLMIIIDHRSNEGLPLVVTTNKNLSEFENDDEHRIGSRLLRYPKAKYITIEANEYRHRRA